MIRWLLLASLLLGGAGTLTTTGAGAGSSASYQGPGDIVSGATAWYGLRAYSSAYAASLGKSVNLRRASDNVTCDVLVAASGGLGLTSATCNSSTQGGITPAAFAGTDATASCTIAGTAAACTGASGTIHVNDPVSGVGISQPCIVTVTNGSTTATVVIAGTSTSCGTVGVAETVTFQVALFVTKAYDQSGNPNDVAQATAANQPQFLPTCLGAGTALPCMRFGGSQYLSSGTVTSIPQPVTASTVAIRTSAFTSLGLTLSGASNTSVGFNSSANSFLIFAGSVLSATVSDSAWHAIQAVINGNGTASDISADGSITTGAAGLQSFGTSFVVGALFNGSVDQMNGLMAEDGFWKIAASSTVQGNLHTNQSAYYGTP